MLPIVMNNNNNNNKRFSNVNDKFGNFARKIRNNVSNFFQDYNDLANYYGSCDFYNNDVLPFYQYSNPEYYISNYSYQDTNASFLDYSGNTYFGNNPSDIVYSDTFINSGEYHKNNDNSNSHQYDLNYHSNKLDMTQRNHNGKHLRCLLYTSPSPRDED